MSSNFGLSYSEIETIHAIDPETSAHNIALAYINSTSFPEKLANGEDVNLSDVLSLSNQYAQAYNYAYNFIVHENERASNAE